MLQHIQFCILYNISRFTNQSCSAVIRCSLVPQNGDESQEAHGMPTTALENRYSYTTFCDTLVGFVLFTGSNTLFKLTETTYRNNLRYVTNKNNHS
jgi:hypothetical protein